MSTFRKNVHLGTVDPLWGTDDFAKESITTEKIADKSVTSDKLVKDAVTNEKIKDGTIENGKIMDGAISVDKLADDFVVTNEMIAEKTIENDRIATDAITNDKIKSYNATTGEGGIENDKFKAGSITGDKIKSNEITSDKIATESLKDFAHDSVWYEDDELEVEDVSELYTKRLSALETETGDLAQEVNGSKDYTEGYYLNSQGELIENEDYCVTDKIDINDTIYSNGVTIYHGTYLGGARICFFKDDELITAYGMSNDKDYRKFDSSDLADVQSQGANNIRFTFYKGYEAKATSGDTTIYTASSEDSLRNKIENNSQDISALQTRVGTNEESIDSLNETVNGAKNYEEGYVINSSGEKVEAEGYCVSGNIELDDAAFEGGLKWTFGTYRASSGIAFFSKDGTMVKYFGMDSSHDYRKFTAETLASVKEGGASYVILSFASDITGLLVSLSDSTIYYKSEANGGLDGKVVELETKTTSIEEEMYLSEKVVGSDATEMAEDITWADTGYYIGYKTNPQSSSSKRYSEPFAVKKGDIIEMSVSKGFKNIPVMFVGFRDSKPWHLVVDGADGAQTFRYIVEEDGYMILNANTLTYDTSQTISWLRPTITKDIVESNEVEHFFPSADVISILANMKKPSAGLIDGTYGNYEYPLCLLHISDVHGSVGSVDRAVRFRDKFYQYRKNAVGTYTETKRYIDDILLSGDICGSSYQTYDSDFGNYNDVLYEIGNHDCYHYYETVKVSGVTTAPTAGAVYSIGEITLTVEETSITSGSGTIKFIQSGGTISSSGTLTKVSGTGDDTIAYSGVTSGNAPVSALYARNMAHIADWGVISAGENLCYYYKDYSEYKVRLVVLDCMNYDEAQNTWFENVLTDALTNDYTVIASQHYTLHESADIVNEIPCAFTSKQNEHFYTNGEFLNNDSLDAVDAFISNGGKFACWLCGHQHLDYIYWLTNHPNQLWVSVAAGAIENTWSDHAWVYGTKAWDIFNVVAVDAHRQCVKIARFGCEYNNMMQKCKTIVLDCKNYDSSLFSESTVYHVGDIVKYNNKLYKFKFLHNGKWASEDVERYNRILE